MKKETGRGKKNDKLNGSSGRSLSYREGDRSDAAENSMKNMTKDFKARAALARRPILSLDVWSKSAADYIRMATFAGFDAQALIVRCMKLSRGQKINIRTVERILDEMSKELAE